MRGRTLLKCLLFAAPLICLALLAGHPPSAAAATNFATVEAYDPATNSWTTKAPMPTARSNVAAATVNGVIYVIGGNALPSDPVFPLSTVEAYNPATNTWTTKTAMPTARSEAAAVAVNNKIYVFGGNNGPYGSPTRLATVEEYDPATDGWTTKTSMPTGRSVLAAAAVGNTVYVIGGCVSLPGCSVVGTVEAYDVGADTWSSAPSMPTARGSLAASEVSGVVYAIGGGNSSGFLGTNEALAGGWTTKAAMPTARNRLATGVVNGLIYAVGGQNDGGVLATVEAYDPIANTWAPKASMPTARSGLTAGVVNNIVYAIGGGTVGPTPTPTPPPAHAVGGILEPVDLDQLPRDAAGSAGGDAPYAVWAGAVGGLLVIAAAGWYARKRWSR